MSQRTTQARHAPARLGTSLLTGHLFAPLSLLLTDRLVMDRQVKTVPEDVSASIQPDRDLSRRAGVAKPKCAASAAFLLSCGVSNRCLQCMRSISDEFNTVACAAEWTRRICRLHDTSEALLPGLRKAGSLRAAG